MNTKLLSILYFFVLGFFVNTSAAVSYTMMQLMQKKPVSVVNVNTPVFVKPVHEPKQESEENNDAHTSKKSKSETDVDLERQVIEAQLKLLKSFEQKEAPAKKEEVIDWQEFRKDIRKNFAVSGKKMLSQYIAFCLNLYLFNTVIPGKPLGNYGIVDIALLRFLRDPVDSQIEERPMPYRFIRGFWKMVFGY